MAKIAELQQGDEIICYMRLGLALETRVTGSGIPFRAVPSKTQKARSQDLSRFRGVVLRNDAVNNVLTVMTTRMDSQRQGINSAREPALEASIHYTAFSKVQRLSKIHSEPRDDYYASRPTSTEGLGTKAKPYRILEDIKIEVT